jgi:hypothetical protein
MNNKQTLTEKDILFIHKSLQNKDFQALSLWIGDDNFKAKEVFSYYKSLGSLETMEAVFGFLPDNIVKHKTKEFIHLVIKKIIDGLEVLVGEEHLLLPEVGQVRSSLQLDNNTFKTIEFPNFFLKTLSDLEKYEIEFKKCYYLKVIDQKQKIIYLGKNIKNFSLILNKGCYHVLINNTDWYLELK